MAIRWRSELFIERQLSQNGLKCMGFMHPGEVASGVLQKDGKDFIVLLGQHPTGAPNDGVTMLYDISSGVRCNTAVDAPVSVQYSWHVDLNCSELCKNTTNS
jgi:hypothetical protein